MEMGLLIKSVFGFYINDIKNRTRLTYTCFKKNIDIYIYIYIFIYVNNCFKFYIGFKVTVIFLLNKYYLLQIEINAAVNIVATKL